MCVLICSCRLESVRMESCFYHSSVCTSVAQQFTYNHTHTNKHSSRFFITTLKPVGVGTIFPIIAALGLFYSMAFLLKTACIDPGIIPRAKPDELDYQLKQADDCKCFKHVHCILGVEVKHIYFSSETRCITIYDCQSQRRRSKAQMVRHL